MRVKLKRCTVARPTAALIKTPRERYSRKSVAMTQGISIVYYIRHPYSAAAVEFGAVAARMYPAADQIRLLI
jgi:hypothetical protein